MPMHNQLPNDENMAPKGQHLTPRNPIIVNPFPDEDDVVKRMHKQASINIRQAHPLKSTFRRRAVVIGNGTNPLDQYKPELANQIGGNISAKINERYKDLIPTQMANKILQKTNLNSNVFFTERGPAPALNREAMIGLSRNKEAPQSSRINYNTQQHLQNCQMQPSGLRRQAPF